MASRWGEWVSESGMEAQEHGNVASGTHVNDLSRKRDLPVASRDAPHDKEWFPSIFPNPRRRAPAVSPGHTLPRNTCWKWSEANRTMLSHPLFPVKRLSLMSQTSPILALQPGAEMSEQLVPCKYMLTTENIEIEANFWTSHVVWEKKFEWAEVDGGGKEVDLEPLDLI